MTVCPKCNYDLDEDEQIYQNDIGVEFRFSVGQSLAGATLMEFHIEKPGGTIIKRTASQYGTTQYITYTSVLGDLDEAGDYNIQAYVEWSTGKHHGKTVIVRVYPEFEAWT